MHDILEKPTQKVNNPTLQPPNSLLFISKVNLFRN